MNDFFTTVFTITGAVVWVAFIVGLIAWATGIADFGLDVGIEEDAKKG